MTTAQIVALAVILVAVLMYVAWQIKKNGLKNTAIQLIVEAEKQLENGDEKMNYCIEKMITLIPMPFSLFVTTDMVKDLIQSVFDKVKVALDYKGE